MAKLDAALDNISYGLCMFGPDGRLLRWNDRYVKMYGITGIRLTGLVAPHDSAVGAG